MEDLSLLLSTFNMPRTSALSPCFLHGYPWITLLSKVDLQTHQLIFSSRTLLVPLGKWGILPFCKLLCIIHNVYYILSTHKKHYTALHHCSPNILIFLYWTVTENLQQLGWHNSKGKIMPCFFKEIVSSECYNTVTPSQSSMNICLFLEKFWSWPPPTYKGT